MHSVIAGGALRSVREPSPDCPAPFCKTPVLVSDGASQYPTGFLLLHLQQIFLFGVCLALGRHLKHLSVNSCVPATRQL